MYIDQRPLFTVSDDQKFWVQDGPGLSNLKDLLDALLTMSNDQYVFHVNRHKNDFASWVELAVGDGECANGLRRARTRSGAVPVVRKALKKYRY